MVFYQEQQLPDLTLASQIVVDVLLPFWNQWGMDDREALLFTIKFALRKLDPWPPKGSRPTPSEVYAPKVLEHLERAGFIVTRKAPTPMPVTGPMRK